MGDSSSEISSSAISEDFQFVNLPLSDSLDSDLMSDSYKVFFHCVKDTYDLNKTLKCVFSFEIGDLEPVDTVVIMKSCVSNTPIICSVELNTGVSLCIANQRLCYYVEFEGNTLPTESSQYIFGYLRSNVLIGSSEPFSFGATESEFTEVEDPNDPGLVVFKSRVDKLNERIEQLNQEKLFLINKLKNTMSTTKSLENELQQKSCLLTNLRSIHETPEKCHQECTNNCSNFPLLVNNMNISDPPQTQQPTLRDVALKLDEVSSSIAGLRNTMENQNHEQFNTLSTAIQKLNDFLELTQSVSNGTVLPEQSPEDTFLQTAEGPCSSFGQHNSDSLHDEINEEPIIECTSTDGNFREIINELTERNATLMSRVSVLELELRYVTTSTSSVLLHRIDELEGENARLNFDLKQSTKALCNFESLKVRCQKLCDENNLLKHLLENQVKHLKHINFYQAKKISTLEGELASVICQKDRLELKLIQLRKDSIGKVSMQQKRTLE